MARLGAADPLLPVMVEPMLCVTLTPTMVAASEKINVIPARAYVKVDCRVPPGLGEDVALQRLRELLGETAARPSTSSSPRRSTATSHPRAAS